MLRASTQEKKTTPTLTEFSRHQQTLHQELRQQKQHFSNTIQHIIQQDTSSKSGQKYCINGRVHSFKISVLSRTQLKTKFSTESSAVEARKSSCATSQATTERRQDDGKLFQTDFKNNRSTTRFLILVPKNGGGVYQEARAKNCNFETPSHNVDDRDVIQWLGNGWLSKVAKEELWSRDEDSPLDNKEPQHSQQFNNRKYKVEYKPLDSNEEQNHATTRFESKTRVLWLRISKNLPRSNSEQTEAQAYCAKMKYNSRFFIKTPPTLASVKQAEYLDSLTSGHSTTNTTHSMLTRSGKPHSSHPH